MITAEIRRQYLAILLAYPFQIPLPTDMVITKGILKHAVGEMSIKLGRHNRTVGYVRDLIRQARDENLEIEKLEKELQTLIEKALT